MWMRKIVPANKVFELGGANGAEDEEGCAGVEAARSSDEGQACVQAGII